MRSVSLWFLLSFFELLTACTGPSRLELDRAIEIQTRLDAVEKLQDGLELPKHFLESPARKRGGEFDVMQTLSFFPHLRMENGYVLDYVYHSEGAGGEPIVYARKKDSPPFDDESAFIASVRAKAHLDEVERALSEYREEEAKAANNTAEGDVALVRLQKRLAEIPDHGIAHWYLTRVASDGSDDGFIELAALRLVCDQFYLFWHACYNDSTLILTKEKADKVMGSLGKSKMPQFLHPKKPPEISAALLAPKVQRTADTVTVSFHVFSRWGGLFRYTFEFASNFPHQSRILEPELVVPYDCGLVY